MFPHSITREDLQASLLRRAKEHCDKALEHNRNFLTSKESEFGVMAAVHNEIATILIAEAKLISIQIPM